MVLWPYPNGPKLGPQGSWGKGSVMSSGGLFRSSFHGCSQSSLKSRLHFFRILTSGLEQCVSFIFAQGCQIKSLCWVFHLQGYVDHAALERVHWQVDTDLPSYLTRLNPGSQNENVTFNLDGFQWLAKRVWILFQSIDFCTLPRIRQGFSAPMFKNFKPNID